MLQVYLLIHRKCVDVRHNVDNLRLIMAWSETPIAYETAAIFAFPEEVVNALIWRNEDAKFRGGTTVWVWHVAMNSKFPEFLLWFCAIIQNATPSAILEISLLVFSSVELFYCHAYAMECTD